MIKRILIALSLLVSIGASFYLGQMSVEPGYTGDTEITDAVFLEVLDALMKDHFSQPDKTLLMEGAVQGMIESLDDPHSTFFDITEYQEYRSNFGESYVGIGVRVLFTDGLIIVEEVFDNSPAEAAGIRPSDIIVRVDGTDITSQGYYDTLGMIAGDVGTDVTIGIRRPGVNDEIQLVLTRAEIENSSVEYTTYEASGQTIGYISVRQFGDETAAKFSTAIDALEASGIDGLVVDVRYNGGGHLSAVLSMLREFLVRNDKPMFTTEYYADGTLIRDDYYGSRDNLRDYNIVTLVNEGSASASEVFASAMSEHAGYALVGTTTYGKGTMQIDRVLRSTDGDRLHLSIGRWLTADGNWVHFNGGSDGITPDLLVEPSAYEQAYKMFLFDGETLVVDTVDDRIANLQLILEALGHDVRTDGYFDTATRDVVNGIKADHALPTDGIVDMAFLSVLNELLDGYLDDPANDTQLQAAIDHLVANPTLD
jgi:carboxyl-terminal processing protease